MFAEDYVPVIGDPRGSGDSGGERIETKRRPPRLTRLAAAQVLTTSRYVLNTSFTASVTGGSSTSAVQV